MPTEQAAAVKTAGARPAASPAAEQAAATPERLVRRALLASEAAVLREQQEVEAGDRDL